MQLKSLLTFFVLVCSASFSLAQSAPTTENPSALTNSPSPTLEARDIMKKNLDNNKGFSDEFSIGEMVLIGSGGERTVREFEFKQLEKNDTEGNKILIKMIKPADLQGTGLLTHQQFAGEDDQWLYLSALKKSKRISGGNRTGRFLGSEFTYEDLSPRELDNYIYKNLRMEPCGDVQCHVIEIIPNNISSGYSKTVSWIRSDNFTTVNLDLYDQKGQLVKKAIFEDYRIVGSGFNLPFKITMKNLSDGRETWFVVKNRRLQTGLTAADFSKRALER